MDRICLFDRPVRHSTSEWPAHGYLWAARRPHTLQCSLWSWHVVLRISHQRMGTHNGPDNSRSWRWSNVDNIHVRDGRPCTTEKTRTHPRYCQYSHGSWLGCRRLARRLDKQHMGLENSVPHASSYRGSGRHIGAFNCRYPH